MQDDQGSSEGQIPEESGSAAADADRDQGPGGQADPGQADPGQADPGQASAGHAGPGDTDPGLARAEGEQPELSQPVRRPQPFHGAPGHGVPGPGYGPPEPGYGQPGPGYGPPGPVYGQPGSGYGPPGGGYGTPGHGYGPEGSSHAYGQPGYSQPGYGYTTPLGYPGGYGQAGGYYPQPGTRARRRRTLLTYLTVAVVAAAAGAGVTGIALSHGTATPPSASGSPGSGPGGNPGSAGGFPGLPGDGAAGAGVSDATKRAVVDKVRPGLVDISSNLGYQGSQAAATGMVISSDGLVLTTNKQYPAKWLGYDSADDVAVIKLVGAHNLKTVPLGDSATVRLGDHVIAIGNAYGAGRFPAVVGSITGTNRTITANDSGAATKETLHGMLQTNAGIVQGDSGGPLASTAGNVIGMDTAAATGSFGDTSRNVGFAIPIDKALRIARQIISGKSSSSVQIGSTGFMGVLVPAGRASQVTS